MHEPQQLSSSWSASRRFAWFTGYTLLLTASFYFNVFNVDGHVRSSHIGYDSYLVLNRLHLAQQGGATLAPMVISAEPADPAGSPSSPYVYNWYPAQIGLQGIIASAVLKATRFDPIFVAYAGASFCSLATAAVLAAFLVSVACRLGALAAHLAAGAIALSPILADFATSLYWCTFLLFAPFVCTWILYPRWSTTTRGLLGLAGLMFVLVGLKSACGYEYLSSITLSPLCAVLFHHALMGDFRLKHLGRCCLLFAAGCAGFAVVITLHAWQLSQLLHHNGLEAVIYRIRMRTSVGRPQSEVQLDFQGRLSALPDAIEYPVNCFLHYFELPAFELPIGSAHVPFWLPTLLGLGLMAFALLRRQQASPTLWALAVGCGTALAASLSWQVLVVNHMCVHFHLNQIVFWIPFLLIVAVSGGWLVQQAALRLGAARRLETLLVPACLMLMVANVERQLLKQIAQSAGEYHRQQQAMALLNQPSEQGAASGIVGCIDGVGQRVRAGDWPRELAGSSLVRFAGETRQELVISGWAADTTSPDAPRKIVVMQGDRVLPEHHTEFVRRPDVEAALKIRAPQAGFTTTVALPGNSTQPLRVFVLSQRGATKATELKHPALAEALGRAQLR